MFINTSAIIKKTIFFGLFLTLHACACVPIKNNKPFPTKAFVQVFKTVKIKKCKPKTACKIGDYTSSGSGGVIGAGRGFTLIMTAKHVCETKFNKQIEDMVLERETVIGIRIWTDQVFGAEVLHVSSNPKLDLCTLKVPGEGMPELQIARKAPQIGDTIYAMSAPAGVYHAPAVPILSGIYSGQIGDGMNSLITIPATGGSSGSLVLNNERRVVGVIFASVRSFYHITQMSSYEETKKFIKESFLKLHAEKEILMSVE